ncbi:hypothetical protein DD864_14245, partial [Staphylococcus pseudintermedius]
MCESHARNSKIWNFQNLKAIPGPPATKLSAPKIAAHKLHWGLAIGGQKLCYADLNLFKRLRTRSSAME